MAFPTDLDTTDISPAVGGALNEVSAGDDILASVYNIVQSGTVALQTKVGADSSAVTTSHDYLLQNLTPLAATSGTAGMTLLTGQEITIDHADGPGATIVTLIADGDGGETDSDTILRLRNSGDSYPGDLLSLGVEHTVATGNPAYSYGFLEIRGIHQTSGDELADIRIGLTTAAFNRLEFTGASTIDFNATVMASNYQLGATMFTGYNEGQGGSSTGTVRIYSGFVGGDVALGTASGPDDIWSLENHKFSSTARFADVVTIDVNDASNPALTVDQDNAAGGWINFVGTMGTPTNNDPTTDAPGDWVQVEIAGSTYYLPAYT